MNMLNFSGLLFWKLRIFISKKILKISELLKIWEEEEHVEKINACVEKAIMVPMKSDSKN